LRSLTALGFGVEPPRAPQRNPDDQQKKQRRGQAEDQMARHGRDPFAPDCRAVDTGDDVDREALKLAMTDAPFDRVDLGPRDRADTALRSLGDHGVRTAACLY